MAKLDIIDYDFDFSFDKGEITVWWNDTAIKAVLDFEVVEDSYPVWNGVYESEEVYDIALTYIKECYIVDENGNTRSVDFPSELVDDLEEFVQEEWDRWISQQDDF